MTTKAKVLKRVKEIHPDCELEVFGALRDCSLEIHIHAPKDYCFNDWGYDTYVLPDLHFYGETMDEIWSLVLNHIAEETGVWHKSEAPVEYRFNGSEWLSTLEQS